MEEAQRMNGGSSSDGPRRKTGPRTTRSAVWNYFEKTDDKTKNICVTCGKMLICNQQNTTNMIRHLVRFKKYLEQKIKREECESKITKKKGKERKWHIVKEREKRERT